MAHRHAAAAQLLGDEVRGDELAQVAQVDRAARRGAGGDRHEVALACVAYGVVRRPRHPVDRIALFRPPRAMRARLSVGAVGSRSVGSTARSRGASEPSPVAAPTPPLGPCSDTIHAVTPASARNPRVVRQDHASLRPSQNPGSKWPMALRCQIVARGEEARLAAAFGLTEQMEPLYRRVLPGSGQTRGAGGREPALAVDELLDQLASPARAGVVSVEDGVLHVVDPATATSRALAQQAEKLLVASRELLRLADVLPALASRATSGCRRSRSSTATSRPWPTCRPRSRSGCGENRGDLCFLRPDQWRFPSESEMAVAVGNAVRRGRRVRAIYPARALTEAPAGAAHARGDRRGDPGGAERPHPARRGRPAPGDRARAPRRRDRPAGRGAPGVDRRDVPGLLRRALGDRRARSRRAPTGCAATSAGCCSPSSPTASRTSRSPATSTSACARCAAGSRADDQLDVDTRFQVGVEAVRRGWL